MITQANSTAASMILVLRAGSLATAWWISCGFILCSFSPLVAPRMIVLGRFERHIAAVDFCDYGCPGAGIFCGFPRLGLYKFFAHFWFPFGLCKFNLIASRLSIYLPKFPRILPAPFQHDILLAVRFPLRFHRPDFGAGRRIDLLRIPASI